MGRVSIQLHLSLLTIQIHHGLLIKYDAYNYPSYEAVKVNWKLDSSQLNQVCAYVNGQLMEKFFNGAQDKSITAFDGDKKSDTFSYKRVYCIVVTYSSGSSGYTCSTVGLYNVSEKINSSILCSLLITSKLHFRMALQLIYLRS